MSVPSLPRVLDSLEKCHGKPRVPDFAHALEWVLWENVGYLVDDERRAEAFAALKSKVGLSAEAILRAKTPVLLAVSELGGMHPQQRVERLRGIAETVFEQFDGDLDSALQLPYPKALAAMKRFPGIGTPGAEKILLLTRTHPVLALESNGLRSLVRLGFGRDEKSYDRTYRSVREAVAPQIAGKDCDWLIRAHHLLRRHGQELCKATRPRCEDCPLQKDCAWFRSGARVDREE